MAAAGPEGSGAERAGGGGRSPQNGGRRREGPGGRLRHGGDGEEKAMRAPSAVWRPRGAEGSWVDIPPVPGDRRLAALLSLPPGAGAQWKLKKISEEQL